MSAAQKNQSVQKPLLSGATILILSGVLLGMVSRSLVNPAYEIHVLVAALSGLTAFLGLKFVAMRRKGRAAEKASRKATAVLENRFERHLPCHTSPKSQQMSDKQPDPIRAAAAR